ncbi:MAG: AMP-binding protein [Tistlia sp.]|uniref:AMP-binding protein n=1 Tax=Tistlia sp. TaxID=3057121 RepID=UPI0034A259CE
MLDLGTSFLASVERDGEATAILDGPLRLSYAQWLGRIGATAEALQGLGLERGDFLLTALQNRWEAATLHWACQFLGLVVTPVNWRVKPEELDFFLQDSGARALVFDGAALEAVARSAAAGRVPRVAVGCEPGAVPAGTLAFESLLGEGSAPPPEPRAAAEDLSLMLYTSGTTGRPKGVPRRHRVERAAALAHVAQNRYGPGERTLGVMPLYHTMGVRSLLAMSLVNGLFCCLPRFDAGRALEVIAGERLTNLYLVPTLYHDLVHHPAFADSEVGSVRKLGFAGAAMTEGLLRRLVEAFRPELFVNHYGSSEIYTFTIDPDAAAKPGSAGKPGLNQRVRVIRLGSDDPEARAAPGEEGQIAADLLSDEAFEGYWQRPDADAKSISRGWYFTGDTGYRDRDGDLFVTGRVDDMIITGGENVFPLEVESALSLHPAVEEVAVAGLPHERWGQQVTAFVRRARPVGGEELDSFCRGSGLADFKRPRAYVFVQAIPKSPVGKILRRLLVAGDYQKE